MEKLSGVRRVMDKSAACMDGRMGMESSSVVEILPKRKRRWREMFLIYTSSIYHWHFALAFFKIDVPLSHLRIWDAQE